MIFQDGPGMSRYVQVFQVCPGMSRYVQDCPGMSKYAWVLRACGNLFCWTMLDTSAQPVDRQGIQVLRARFKATGSGV
jgi:hypothetical protein